MNKSESIANLAAALIKAQANIGGAVKGTANPFFRSKFADLGEIIGVCKAALLDEGIAVSQMPCTLPSGAPGLETILLHSSGEWMSNSMPVICAKEKDPQALGSAITYARRYALQSALLIPAVDDDGEAAMYRQETPQPKAQPKQKASQPPAESGPGSIRIHFGKNRGLRLDELTPQQRGWYIDDWAPKKAVNGPTSQEDSDLLEALKSYKPASKAKGGQAAPVTPKESPQESFERFMHVDNFTTEEMEAYLHQQTHEGWPILAEGETIANLTDERLEPILAHWPEHRKQLNSARLQNHLKQAPLN